MNRLPVETIGLVAASLSTASFIPQAIKILRTQDTRAISLVMYSMLTSGAGLWFIYGILVSSPGLIIGNFITVTLSDAILVLKIKHG